MAVKATFTIQINNSITEKTKNINIANPKTGITKALTGSFKDQYALLYGQDSGGTTTATTIVQSYYSNPTFVDEPAV